MDITPILRKDIDAIYAIECDSFIEQWDKEIFTLFAIHTDGVVIERGRRSFGRAARIKGTIGGYIIWEINNNTRTGRVLNIAVRRDLRRKGIGISLMAFVLRHMYKHGMKRCELETRESNIAARRLYEQLDMKEMGRVPGYYGDEDAIIYTIYI